MLIEINKKGINVKLRKRIDNNPRKVYHLFHVTHTATAFKISLSGCQLFLLINEIISIIFLIASIYFKY